MLSSFLQTASNYCFSPSSKTAPLPHYLYDILHENPFKVLHILYHEFKLGTLQSLLLIILFWVLLYGKIENFFSCNWMVCGWLVSMCVINHLVLIPKYWIFDHIKNVQKFMINYQQIDGINIQDVLRDLLWNHIFQTKIYVFTQTLIRNISFSYFSGIILIIIDSGEHGFFKACRDDGGLKKFCLLIILLSFLKLYLIKKNIIQGGNFFQSLVQVKRINKEECLKAKIEEKVCSICLLDFEENQEINLMKCNHFFHKGCLAKWLKNQTKCPYCMK